MRSAQLAHLHCGKGDCFVAARLRVLDFHEVELAGSEPYTQAEVQRALTFLQSFLAVAGLLLGAFSLFLQLRSALLRSSQPRHACEMQGL